MKITESSGTLFTERDVAGILAAADRIEAAMGLPNGATGKLKLTHLPDGGAPVTLLTLTPAAGEGGNCADEKTRALIDNPSADFTTDCVFQVGGRDVSYQGGLRVRFDGGDLLIACSGLAGWQDLFFTITAAAAIARNGGFGDGRAVTAGGLAATLSKNKENDAIYHLVMAIL